MTSPADRGNRAEAGFSLIEAMVATIIALIAVIGLAFTFSTGRGMVDRFATARDALAAAEQRMERLSILGLKSPADTALAPGNHGPLSRSLNGNPSGTEQWTVTWVDDPADNTGGDINPKDYKLVTVTVRWMSGSIQEQLQLTRIILGT